LLPLAPFPFPYPFKGVREWKQPKGKREEAGTGDSSSIAKRKGGSKKKEHPPLPFRSFPLHSKGSRRKGSCFARGKEEDKPASFIPCPLLFILWVRGKGCASVGAL